MTSLNETDGLSEGSTLSWADVSKIHQIRNGIYQRNGRLISLLTDFGRINPCYPDVHGQTADTIFYTGNGRRGDQKLDMQNRALLDAITSGVSVPLFNKHAPGKWEFMGYWKVLDGRYIFDEKQERMVWRFTLQKSSQ
jgi:5-methylcytosine-specific restriction protein A